MALDVEKKDNIVCITLNRPEKLNSFNVEALKKFQQIIQDFNRDDGLRVAVITGAGDKAFCAGMDMSEVSAGKGQDPAEALWQPDLADTKFLHENGVIKPVIAAVNGVCVGLALNLVLDCDIRIASDNASFMAPEVKSGLCSRVLGILLARSVPLSTAMEMVLIGERLGAQEAYRCGLVSRLLPPEQLMTTALSMAGAIASNAPLAVRANKETVIRGIDMPFDHASRLAVSLAFAVQNSEDYKEGLLAFLEKRKPQYKGK
jgi:enoyl-CoA hydratase/carnithine racemase